MPGITRHLCVQHTAIGVEHAFLHRLGNGRMREDRVHQVFFGRLQIHGDHEALDEFGDFRAHHMCAEQLAGLLVEDGLDHTLVFAERNRLAVCRKGEAANADVAALFLGLGFGETDRSDLRIAIGAARNLELVHGMHIRQTGDLFDADDSLVLSLVGEQWRTRDVTDGVDTGHVGLAVTVDDDEAAIGLHASSLKADALDVGNDADGGDHPIGRNLFRRTVLLLQRRGDGVRALLHLGNLGFQMDLHALLLELLFGEGRDFGVFDRHDLTHDFNHGHVDAHGAVEAGEFDADGARAHDEQRLGHFFRLHRLEIGPDQLAIRLDAGQRARAGARCDDNVLGSVSALAQRVFRHGPLRLNHRLGGFADDDLARLGDLGFTPDDIDLVLLEQETDAIVHAGCNAARARHDCLDVRLDRAFQRQAIILGVGGGVHDIGGAQQGLGGNAAPVGADAGQMLTLHDGNLHAELGCADRGNVAARSRTDDDDVI
ncbi:hypothetical protein AT6N2_C0861 [Agrobacterium tumefaciens]|nr:hypothetical protein AT6N2_C0861 [Agrobacterium tumefaciens]